MSNATMSSSAEDVSVRSANSAELQARRERLTQANRLLIESHQQQFLQQSSQQPPPQPKRQNGNSARSSSKEGKRRMSDATRFSSSGKGIRSQSDRKLLRACMDRNEVQAVDFVKHGANPDVKNSHGQTPLHYAVQNGHGILMSLLITKRCDVDVQDENGDTALHFAAKLKNFKATKALVKYGANMKLQNSDGFTPLHSAISMNSVETLAIMVQGSSGGVDLSLRDHYNMTPLLAAVTLGQTDIVRILLTKGADPTARDARGSTPLHIAVINTDHEIVELLSSCHPQVFEMTDPEGLAPLHLAVREGLDDMAKIMLESGHAVENVLDNNGRTPMHWACMCDAQSCVKLILDSNPQLNIQDRYGATCVHYAVQQTSISCLEAIFEDPEHAHHSKFDDHLGRQPLMWAVLHNTLAACKALLVLGINPDITDEQGFTALHYAVHESSEKFCKLLAGDFGCDPDVKDKNNAHTPLFHAVVGNKYHCASILLELGCREDLVDNDGRTCVHWAVRNENVKMLKLLLNVGCPPDVADNDNTLPIHISVKQGNVQMTKLLLEVSSLNVNDYDNSGLTALHSAAMTGNTELCQLLLANNADAKLKSKKPQEQQQPKTAYDFAVTGQFSECAEVLQVHLDSLEREQKRLEEAELEDLVEESEGQAGSTLAKEGSDGDDDLDGEKTSKDGKEDVAQPVTTEQRESTASKETPSNHSSGLEIITHETNPGEENNKHLEEMADSEGNAMSTDSTHTINDNHTLPEMPRKRGSLSRESSISGLPAIERRGSSASITSEHSSSAQQQSNHPRSKIQASSTSNSISPVRIKGRTAAAEYDGLTAPLMMTRGSGYNREAHLNSLVEHKEAQIRRLKQQNRELRQAQEPKAVLAKIGGQVADIRTSLSQSTRDIQSRHSENHEIQRKAIKKEVQKALVEMRKLRVETDALIAASSRKTATSV